MSWKNIKKSLASFHTTVQQKINEISEESKERVYQKRLALVEKLKSYKELRTSRDLSLFFDQKISKKELEDRAIHRNNKLQEKINKLSDEPTYKELEDLMGFFDKLTKE